MLKKRKKVILLTIILVFCLLFTLIIFFNFSQKITEIDFLDVGQGDASLIKITGGKVILIDGGPDNIVLKRLGENLSFFKRKIDLIILSHPHDDHIIGLLEVIRRYKVGAIIYVGDEGKTELLTMLLKTAEERNVHLINLRNEANMNYSSSCSLYLLNPISLKVKNDDNNSIVSRLDCDGLRAIFSGDNNFAVEKVLLETGNDWSAEIMKASHHGSKTANSEAFLKAVNPKLFVISVGVDNRFGHPHEDVLKRVKNLKINLKRTDNEGTIKVFGESKK